jgi:1-deoxy-D-xylulose-5-phosphate reductoisomerase
MRLPIALGLGWPDRVPEAVPACDWTAASRWEFFPLDEEAFPAVALARTAGQAGGVAPAVYNAADEVAVEAFLAGALPFTGIVDTVARVLEEHITRPVAAGNRLTFDDVLEADAWARARAREITQLTGSVTA